MQRRFIPIEIPTKKYIKAYITNRFGERPIIDKRSNIGLKLYDLLNHIEMDSESELENKRYNVAMKLYISHRTFCHRGAFISNHNIKNFNYFLEEEVKTKFRFYMDWHVSGNGSFEKNLPLVRQLMGIDEDDWETESLKKDYYRYRLKTGFPLLYRKS